MNAALWHALAVLLAGASAACLFGAIAPLLWREEEPAPRDAGAGALTTALRRRLAHKTQTPHAEEPRLTRALRMAGLKLRPSLFLGISGLCGAAAGFCAFAVSLSLAAGALAAILVATAAPLLLLKSLTARRARLFRAAFASVIASIERGAASGMALTPCLRLAARDCAAPLNAPLMRLADELAAGAPPQTAFSRFAAEAPIVEARFFAFALALQYETGASARITLANLADMLRARARLEAKVAALSAEAKISALIIGALPFAAAGALTAAAPDYLEPLWRHPAGRLWLCGAGLWMLTGILAILMLCRYERVI